MLQKYPKNALNIYSTLGYKNNRPAKLRQIALSIHFLRTKWKLGNFFEWLLSDGEMSSFARLNQNIGKKSFAGS